MAQAALTLLVGATDEHLIHAAAAERGGDDGRIVLADSDEEGGRARRKRGDLLRRLLILVAPQAQSPEHARAACPHGSIAHPDQRVLMRARHLRHRPRQCDLRRFVSVSAIASPELATRVVAPEESRAILGHSRRMVESRGDGHHATR